jgi:hypothetical protein
MVVRPVSHVPDNKPLYRLYWTKKRHKQGTCGRTRLVITAILSRPADLLTNQMRFSVGRGEICMGSVWAQSSFLKEAEKKKWISRVKCWFMQVNTDMKRKELGKDPERVRNARKWGMASMVAKQRRPSLCTGHNLKTTHIPGYCRVVRCLWDECLRRHTLHMETSIAPNTPVAARVRLSDAPSFLLSPPRCHRPLLSLTFCRRHTRGSSTLNPKP